MFASLKCGMLFMVQKVETVPLLLLPLALLRRLLSSFSYRLLLHTRVRPFHQGCMESQIELSSHPSSPLPPDLPDLVPVQLPHTALRLSYTSIVTPLLIFPCTRHSEAHQMPTIGYLLKNEHHLSSADDDTCGIPHLNAEDTR